MKVAREGWPFVAVPGVIALGLMLVGRRRLATPFAAASLASLGFFRAPDLSPLDVHVNRAPIAGLVVARRYEPGRFLAAYRSDASERNERCVLHLQGEKVRVAVTQIAGVLARRIVCRVGPGDKLEAGERFGLIRFGSRTDLTVPRDTQIQAHVGARVRGGESVIGVLR